MAKKKKNTRRSRAKKAASRVAAEKANSDPKQLEALTYSALQAGNVQRAREGYKRLHKLIPEKFAPELARTTLLAAEDNFQNGRFDQCSDLLNQFADYPGTTDQDREKARLLEIQSNLHHSQRTIRVDAALAILRADHGFSQEVAANILVLAKHEEAQPVTRAIQALCNKQWEALDKELKSISRQSPFSEWRVFLAGCGAFHQGDRNLASRCFSRLHQDTYLANKALAYLVMLGEVDPIAHTDAQEQIGHFVGIKSIIPTLAKADQAWKKEDVLGAKNRLATLSGFPGFQLDLIGHLTRTYLNSLSEVDPDERMKVLFEMPPSVLGNPKVGTKGLFLSTMFLGCVGRKVGVHEIDILSDKMWSVYEKSHTQIFGKSDRFRAMLYLYRASHAWDEGLDRGVFSHNLYPTKSDVSEALTFFGKAISADPTFEPAYSVYLAALESAKMTSASNQLLDRMSEQFPESPSILLNAGAGCMKRSAYKKALGYFRRARELNPLDAQIGEGIYMANLNLALGYAVKDKAHLLLPVLEEMASYSQDGAPVPYGTDFCHIFTKVIWKYTPSSQELPLPAIVSTSLASGELSAEMMALYSALTLEACFFSTPKSSRTSQSSNKFLLAPEVSLPPLGKTSPVFSDALPLIRILTIDLGFLFSEVTNGWIKDMLIIIVKSMGRENLKDAEELALLTLRFPKTLGFLTTPLAKVAKKVDKNELFFQLFDAVVSKRFPKRLTETVAQLNHGQKRNANLSELANHYERGQSDRKYLGTPSPFHGGWDDADDDDVDLSTPLPKPKKKPRTPSKAVPKKDPYVQEDFDW